MYTLIIIHKNVHAYYYTQESLNPKQVHAYYYTQECLSVQDVEMTLHPIRVLKRNGLPYKNCEKIVTDVDVLRTSIEINIMNK